MPFTKYYDWDRFKDMTSRQKSEITTESTFGEQRKEDEEKPPKDFGIKQMEEEVNIDLGKSQEPASIYTTPGALSAKRSGGKEGIKFMHELDKFKRKEPSELDPKKEEESEN